MREGIFNKVSKGCWEVRGKTLGIVGYGHIGSQLSVLAEACVQLDEQALLGLLWKLGRTEWRWTCCTTT